MAHGLKQILEITKKATLYMQAPAKISLPEGKSKLLLHSCCAPCAGEIILSLLNSNIDYAIYFYNPNIHPRKEYELRKQENIRFAKKHGIEFFDDDYNVRDWFDRASELKDEPEKGVRCTMCFDMRFEYSARFAHENGYDIFCSTLGISRWKNMAQINASGIRAAMHYPNLAYFTYNWRKQGGGERMLQVSKKEKFYQQEYCGCAYSLRDTNKSRLERNKGKVELGKNYYTDK